LQITTTSFWPETDRQANQTAISLLTRAGFNIDANKQARQGDISHQLAQLSVTIIPLTFPSRDMRQPFRFAAVFDSLKFSFPSSAN
jgi:hypothetical protein